MEIPGPWLRPYPIRISMGKGPGNVHSLTLSLHTKFANQECNLANNIFLQVRNVSLHNLLTETWLARKRARTGIQNVKRMDTDQELELESRM